MTKSQVCRVELTGNQSHLGHASHSSSAIAISRSFSRSAAVSAIGAASESSMRLCHVASFLASGGLSPWPPKPLVSPTEATVAPATADPAAIAMFCVLRATSIVSARLPLPTSRPLWATSIVSATLPLPTSRPLLTAALVASIVIAMPLLPSLPTAPVDAVPILFVASMVMATPPLPIASPLLVTRVIVLAAVEAALLASP